MRWVDPPARTDTHLCSSGTTPRTLMWLCADNICMDSEAIHKVRHDNAFGEADT